MKRLIIIGTGMGAIKLAEKLVTSPLNSQLHITMIGEESCLPYNRILLSDVLAGERPAPTIIDHQVDWFESHGIDITLDDKVVAIDTDQQQLATANGRSFDYDYLVLATGSHVFKPPITGIDHPAVIPYRNLADVQRMARSCPSDKDVLVMGGGLLGLEAAWALRQRGNQVSVVHLLPTLMERQIDQTASDLLQAHLEHHGIRCYTNYRTQSIIDKAGGLRLQAQDGPALDADHLVLATGIRPNMSLADDAGLVCDRGILVDEFMQTSNPHVFAFGECAQFQNECVGLVAPVYQMAEALVRGLDAQLHDTSPAGGYQQATYLTKLKVSGIDLCSAGAFQDGEDRDTICLHDPALGIYKKIVLQDHKIIGFLNYGDTDNSDWLFEQLQSQVNITSSRRSLMFGPQGQGGDDAALRQIEAMSDDHEVCGCNGVNKGAIVSCVQSQNLSSLEAVKQQTKAATGCGSCQAKVNNILKWQLQQQGTELVETKSTVCACTDLSHDEVRAQIKTIKAQTIFEAFAQLGWHKPDGCPRCRPAINYYLLCEYPETYQDHQPSRFVNERQHANIQKDGTFSVIPRMFGGLTSPDELRLLADVADEFAIPCVKVTGGQRIDLLGARKEDLARIWTKLNQGGMVSGHAYGKAVRTVKTCVGSEWCRFGTQDSTGLGVALEKMCWGAWTPHKVKMAVSGCPRNCAESTIKDIGVIAVDSGWELYLGGNGGTKVRVSDFLVKVDTDAEVYEYTGALLQLYREQARYLERTSHWVERVGLKAIKQLVVDSPEQRATLYQRFQKSQNVKQKDPWAALNQAQQAAH
jgi:nitrite reductase (NADH) large subunit